MHLRAAHLLLIVPISILPLCVGCNRIGEPAKEAEQVDAERSDVENAQEDFADAQENVAEQKEELQDARANVAEQIREHEEAEDAVGDARRQYEKEKKDLSAELNDREPLTTKPE